MFPFFLPPFFFKFGCRHNLWPTMCTPSHSSLCILLSSNLTGRAFTCHDENQSNITLHSDEEKEVPTAYIVQVTRNYKTFHYFLKLAEEADLYVVDITETKSLQHLLPYMLSYDRSSVWLFRVLSSRGKHISLRSYVWYYFICFGSSVLGWLSWFLQSWKSLDWKSWKITSSLIEYSFNFWIFFSFFLYLFIYLFIINLGTDFN